MRPAPVGPVGRLVRGGPVRRRRRASSHRSCGGVCGCTSVVVVVDKGGDLLAGLVFGGEVPARQQFVLEG